MPLVIEIYEATQMKSGDVIFTFDADALRPTGDLSAATIDRSAILTLTWADGSVVRLPDVRDRLADAVRAAPTIAVRWVSDGLLRGADFRQHAAHALTGC